MANPTEQSVYIDLSDSRLLQGYQQEQKGFITNKYPWLPVDAETGLYPVFDKNDFLRDEMQVWPDDTDPAHSGWRLSTNPFKVIPYALDKRIGPQAKANSQSRGGLVDLRMGSIRWLGQKVNIRADRQFATDIFAANTWGGGTGNDITLSNLWSDQTLGDPLADMYTLKEDVVTSIGRLPNTSIMGWQVKKQLVQHPEIKDQFKFTTAQSITDDMLAAFFEVDNLWVASSIYASNVEGGTKTNNFIVGKAAWMGYLGMAAEWGAPSAFYTLYWTELTNSLPGINVGVSNFFDQNKETDVYRAKTAFAHVVTAPDAGWFIPSAVA